VLAQSDPIKRRTLYKLAFFIRTDMDVEVTFYVKARKANYKTNTSDNGEPSIFLM